MPPELSEKDAASVVGGFVASGRGQDVVEAIERALLNMGAQVRGLVEGWGGGVLSCRGSDECLCFALRVTEITRTGGRGGGTWILGKGGEGGRSLRD